MGENEKSWNVVATSRRTWEKELIGELKGFGDFRGSGFGDVILGSVEEMRAFLEALRVRWTEKLFLQMILSSVVPIQTVFRFTKDTLLTGIMERVNPLVERMGAGSFCVRMKRRGHKRELSGFETERAVGEYVYDRLAAQGKSFRVDFSSPDYVIAIETLHDQCGVGLIDREWMERFPFVRIR